MTSRTEPRRKNDARRSTLLCACLIAGACSSVDSTTPGTGGTSGAPTTGGSGGTTTGAGPTTGGTGGTTTGRGPTTSVPGTGGMGPAAGGRSGGASGTGTSTGGTSVAMGGSGGPTTPPTVEGGGSVLQYHKNASRDGHYVEPTFTRAAAAMMKKDPSFSAMISGDTYAQPLYWEGSEGKDLVITATLTNEVSAFDAATGMMVWRKTIAPPGPQGGGPGGCSLGNVSPLGVLGTPVIDAASKTLFVATMTTGGKHQVFALALEDGSTKPGWPADVTTVKSGSTTFNSPAENQRGALLIVNKTLYVPYGGHYGDCGDYRGWVVGIPLDNPAAPFGWATRASAGGIWAPNGLASDGTSVFAATGNTMAAPSGAFPMFSSPSMWGDGEAIIRFAPDLKFSMANTDYFAADNWAALDSADYDIGGSGVTLFDVPGATPSKVAIALGKDGTAWLADQANLGGMGGELGMPTSVSPGAIMQAPVAYTTPTGTFVAMRAPGVGCPGGGGAITGLKISAASPPAISVGWCGGPNSTGSPMVTTTDGKTDSIVWYVGGGKLVGLNGETGAEVFNGESIGASAKWQTPIAAKGRIFFAANNEVYAFKP